MPSQLSLTIEVMDMVADFGEVSVTGTFAAVTISGVIGVWPRTQIPVDCIWLGILRITNNSDVTDFMMSPPASPLPAYPA
jgi:hypothetical protein